MAAIRILVVGGGGGGGSGVGGGGGGGGVVADDINIYYNTEYAVIVGDGGAAGVDNWAGGVGDPSSFDDIVAGGGGASGCQNSAASQPTAHTGSGGGGGGGTNQPSPQAHGDAGADGLANAGADGLFHNRGGGGGGAGAAGSGADGGVGYSSDISGSDVVYGSGGGAGTDGAAHGVGGTNAGDGGIRNTENATNGAVNKGGGGGGGGGTCEPSFLVSVAGAGGSGVVIVRYLTADFGVCTGGNKTVDGDYTVHTFTTDGTFVGVAEFVASGSTTFGPFVIPTMIEEPADSSIDWTETVPANTTLVVKTAIVVGVAAEEDYEVATNGSAIPSLEMASSGLNLYIKAYLDTADTMVTPTLDSLSYEIVEATDTTKVRVTLASLERMKFPQGNVTVHYNKTAGGMSGIGGGQVENYDLVFTPAGIVPVFNPMAYERIEMDISAVVDRVHVDYNYFESTDENIELDISVIAIRYHVDDIPE